MAKERKHTPLTRVLQALANPLRLRMLAFMARRPASASDCVRLFEGVYPVNHLAYHFKVLREAGLIEMTRKREVRGSTERFYSVNPSAFLGLVDWPELPAPLNGLFQGLSASAFFTPFVDVASTGGLSAEGSLAGWRPIRVDAKGSDELKASVAELLDVLPEIEKRSATRAQTAKHGSLETVFVGAAAFPPTGSGL